MGPVAGARAVTEMGALRPRHRIRVGRPPLPDSGSLRRRRVDAPAGRSGARRAVAIVLAALCLAPGAGLAAPGDPFGSDDAGCGPDTRGPLHCASAPPRPLSTPVRHM